MKRSMRAYSQYQITACVSRCAVVSVYLVIVHLLMIHTLHVITGPETAPAHHLTVGSNATHMGVSSTDPVGGDVNCTAPDFVAQRFEIPLADVDLDAITVTACDAPLPLASGMSEVTLPRPPGPERQAILQRFTL